MSAKIKLNTADGIEYWIIKTLISKLSILKKLQITELIIKPYVSIVRFFDALNIVCGSFGFFNALFSSFLVLAWNVFCARPGEYVNTAILIDDELQEKIMKEKKK